MRLGHDSLTGYKYGNFVAERFPADLSVFFLHGPTPNVQQGQGASWSDWTFVRSSPLQPQPCTGTNNDVIHMAHEIGHYLGLAHTFSATVDPVTKLPRPYATRQEAEDAFNKNACRSSMFDGDGISDTNFEPYNDFQQCEGNVQTVNLYCNADSTLYPFYPDKDNAMSYFRSPNWPWDKTLSTGQMNRIESVLKNNALRIRLE